jgi:hypothetical protein
VNREPKSFARYAFTRSDACLSLGARFAGKKPGKEPERAREPETEKGSGEHCLGKMRGMS